MNYHNDITFVLRQILQDYLIPESEYNSVEFDAIFGRYSDLQLASCIKLRVSQNTYAAELAINRIEELEAQLATMTRKFKEK